jgi:hypothetical protein
MRVVLPATSYGTSHADHAEINVIESAVLKAAGGASKLISDLGAILREDIDIVIDTPRTARCDYEELEKTEKTYIGTRVEIGLRELLGFPKGVLDLYINGVDVDIKFTGGNNWMIPAEANDKICILVAADEARSRCYLGLLKMRSIYLTGGGNRDGKKSISAAGFCHICWLVKDEVYKPNFWRSVSKSDRESIFSLKSGTARLVKLFEQVQHRPIDRSVVESVARQKDYMKRLRTNGGARDALARNNLVLLSGKYDSSEIQKRGLPFCSVDEFICTKA